MIEMRPIDRFSGKSVLNRVLAGQREYDDASIPGLQEASVMALNFFERDSYRTFLTHLKSISGSPKLLEMRNRCLAYLYDHTQDEHEKKVVAEKLPLLAHARERGLNVSAMEIYASGEAAAKYLMSTLKPSAFDYWKLLSSIVCTMTPDQKIEAAKLSVQEYRWHTRFDTFEIDDLDTKIEIVKFAVEHSVDTACSLSRNLRESNEAVRVEIAKRCARRCGYTTAQHMSSFNIRDEAARVEIAEICAEQDGRGTSEFIQNFAIANKDARLKLAKLCSDPRNFQNFAIEDEEERVDCAKIYAERNGAQTACLFKNFQIDSSRFFNEVLPLCVVSDKYSLKYVGEINGEFTDFANVFSGRCSQSDANQFVANYIEKNMPGCGFDWAVPYITSIKDPYIHNELISTMTAILFLFRTQLSDIQLQFANENRFIEAIFTSHAPHLYFPFALSLYQFLQNEEAVAVFQETESLERLVARNPFMKFARIAFAQIPGSNLPALLEKNFKIFKDGPKARLVADALRRLADEPSLSLEQKLNLLNALAGKNGGKQMYKAFQDLTIILDLKEIDLLLNVERGLDALALDAINRNIPIGEIPNGSTRFIETFLSSRNPTAILQYAAKMKQTNDPKATLALAQFVKAVLENKFLDLRYDLANSPHLQTVGQDTIDLWRVGGKGPLALKEEAIAAFDARKWLHTKLVLDRHFQEMPSLIRFLEAKTIEEADAVYDEFMNQKRDEPLSLLEDYCFTLARAQDRREQLDALSDMAGALGKLPKSEFASDVKGQIKSMISPNQSRKLFIVDSDDPYDLLLSGTEVMGSCQRVDGNPFLNKGLLGYLLNGQIRMLAVVDNQGKIAGRSLLRMLWDGEKPVLFLERHYGDDKYAPEIRGLAEAKAKAMGLSLTTSSIDAPKAPHYGKSIHSLGGIAPFEYCDATGGVTNGIYEIRAPKVLS